MFKHIPNAITCLNLFSGCIGVVFAFDGNLKSAGYAILISAFLDFFDGMAARLLNAHSPIGKELDSLADMVSFGFLPSVILFQLLGQSSGLPPNWDWLRYSAFLIAIFSALRLAKFNVDTRQTDSFIGLPTPSCALVILALPYLKEQNETVDNLLNSPFFLIAIVIILSFLLVAELPLMSLKFKDFTLKNNVSRYILIFLATLLLITYGLATIPVIIFFYILLSVWQTIAAKSASKTV